MAFCNSCGNNLAPGTQFCNKCGAAVPGGPVPGASTSAAAAAPTGGSSALKIILIVFAVIVALGVLGIATVSFVAYRVAKSSHVTHDGDHVKVETPFGRVETTNDPQQAARDLGVDIYPGAEVQKNGAASATFGGVHTTSANFQSTDPPDKVCDFYKSRYPNSMVTTGDQRRCTIVSNDKQNMITINVEENGDTTKLQITNVSKKAPNSE